MSSNGPTTFGYENINLMTSLQNLYWSDEIADVKFVFELADGKHYHVAAHKTLLAARSDVFKVMFYGPAKKKGDIKIVDATVGAFQEFLQFFYLNRVKLTSDNIACVMNLVNKYNVIWGMDVCIAFLKDTLTDENACTAYELAILYELHDLKRFVEQKISANTKTVFESKSFLQCTRSTLGHILQLDQFSCPETEVFKACIGWMSASSGQDIITREVVQTYLGDLFYQIGFGSMKIDEFAPYGGLFTDEEYTDIIQMIGSKEYESKLFKMTPRMAKLRLIECNRVSENKPIQLLRLPAINAGASGSGNGSYGEQRLRCRAAVYGYDLVGDDFFLEMAKKNLGSSVRNLLDSITGRRKLQSGLCISGQRIRDATERLKEHPNTRNMKIIVNLGTVDILNGRGFYNMCNDYKDLVETCDRRSIEIIITTLAPIIDIDEDDFRKWREFNRFLIHEFSEEYEVIAIARCMMTYPFYTGTINMENYQREAKTVTGSLKPHVLWSNIGRKRILKEIKSNLRR